MKIETGDNKVVEQNWIVNREKIYCLPVGNIGQDECVV